MIHSVTIEDEHIKVILTVMDNTGTGSGEMQMMSAISDSMVEILHTAYSLKDSQLTQELYSICEEMLDGIRPQFDALSKNRQSSDSS